MSVKKVNILGLVFAAILASGISVQAAELKIGVVNAGTVLDQSPQKAKALARLEKEFSSRSKALQKRIKNLKTMQEKLAKDGAILSADKRKIKERKVLSEQRELKRLQDEYSECT